MSDIELLAADVGRGRTLTVRGNSRGIEVVAHNFGAEPLLFHWGIAEDGGHRWKPPSLDVCTASTPASVAVEDAAQISFPPPLDDGSRRIRLSFPPSHEPSAVLFVLHGPPHEWIKKENNNFRVIVPPPRSLLDAAVQRVKETFEADSLSSTAEWVVRGVMLIAVASTNLAGICSMHFLALSADRLMLHFGAVDDHGGWQFARSVDFESTEESVQEVCATLDSSEVTDHIRFVLKVGANWWVKDGNKDFELKLPRHPEIQAREESHAGRSTEQLNVDAPIASLELDTSVPEIRAELPVQIAESEAPPAFQTRIESFRAHRGKRQSKADVSFHIFELAHSVGEIEVCCRKDRRNFEVEVVACLDPEVVGTASPPPLLHWGALSTGKRKVWECPPEDILPTDSEIIDAKACQTPFVLCAGLYRVAISVPSEESGVFPLINGIGFVVRLTQGDQWLKNRDGRDCLAVFRTDTQDWKGACKHVAARILEAECEWGHMTLMHRYRLCTELVSEWEASEKGDSQAQLRRLPSWGALFRTEPSRQASWSRLPSSSMLVPQQPATEELDTEFWSWVFVWQRMSFVRLLDWQRNYNTKPRELAAATNDLADKLCTVWKENPAMRPWARWTLATLGRGGNRGQDIRDEILHIMHRHKIPESAGHFYEQWHQKLHNNTTPDDIGICKALIAFLRSGMLNQYYSVLYDHGITRERLSSYERPITKEPYVHGNPGHLIFEFENYLKILQSVHDATDLQTALDDARWCLSTDLQDKILEVRKTTNQDRGIGRTRSRSFSDLREVEGTNLEGNHRRFMLAADARLCLLALLNDRRSEPKVIRQILLLDYSLETTQTVLVQAMGKELRLPQLCEQMQALLTSVLGHMPLHAELRAALLDWMRLSSDCACFRWGAGPVESALLLKAMCDRLARVVGDEVDMIQALVGPKVEHLGAEVGAPRQVLEVFVDEILRGSALFSVSLLLKRLEPVLRETAQLPPWQMVSAVGHPVQGELHVIDRMLHMQEKIFEVPTVLLSGAVSGEEEVPVGVQAVLVRSAAEAPDILSHCAVRARNSGVLLATCFDPSVSEQLAELEGQWVEVRCRMDGTLLVEVTARPATGVSGLRKMSRTLSLSALQESLQVGSQTKLVEMNLTDDFGCEWCVLPADMDESVVGSKSLNLTRLTNLSEVRFPQALALPFGCFQKTLACSANRFELERLQKVLQDLQPTTSHAEAKDIFKRAQICIRRLDMPPELAQALEFILKFGNVGPNDLFKLYQEDDAWDAIKRVWASLFCLRPWVSLAKANRSFHDLKMAVLVQELIPAKYAFVLHTANPLTHNAEELYGELVPGRGETLVGNYPGRALGFTARRGAEPAVTSFCSKSTWLKTQECLIFRSDSNGEDLEGFAGAGLFESICGKQDIPCMVKLHRLQVLTDTGYRMDLLQRLANVGWAVEAAFGGIAQDIEGCVDPQDRICIVQSRPQV